MLLYTAAVLPSTLFIGYYHGLLLLKLDTNFITTMHSTHLLTSHEQELILDCHSVHQRNCLLLELVRHMKMKNTLFKFCELVEESTPTVGIQLVVGTYINI